MLYHIIYSVRYYPRFHITAAGLGTYYPRIQGSTCTNTPNHICYIIGYFQSTYHSILYNL